MPNRGVLSGLVEGPEDAPLQYDGSGNLGLGYLTLNELTEQYGTAANPGGVNNVSIGNGAGQFITTGFGNVCIGVNSGGAGLTATNGSTVIGTGATVSAGSTVAIGFGAIGGTGASSVVIGTSATGGTAAGGANVVIGTSASAGSQSEVVVIGDAAAASGAGAQATVVIGYLATDTNASSPSDNVIIGPSATCSAQDCVVIGASSSSTATGNTIVGFTVTSGGAGVVLVGYEAAGNTSSVSVGYEAGLSTSGSCVAVGYEAKAGISNGIAIGYQAGNTDTVGNGPADTIAIGYQATAKMTAAAAVGYQAYATTANQFVIGNPATTTNVWVPSTLTVGNPGNVLTANQSAFTLNATTGWTAGANSVIASVQPNASLSGDYALYGEYAMSLHTSTGGDTSTATTPTGTSGFAVIAGGTYTAVASIANGSGSPVNGGTVTIFWWTSAGSAASTPSNASSTVTPSTTVWSPISVTAVAPSNAAYASVTLTNLATVTTELYLFDCVGFWAGTATNWVLGGTAASALGPGTPALVVATAAGVELTTTSATDVISYTGAGSGLWRLEFSLDNNSGSSVNVTATLNYSDGIGGPVSPIALAGVIQTAMQTPVAVTTYSLAHGTALYGLSVTFRANAAGATPITLAVTAGTASEIFVWATLEQLTSD